MKSDLCERLLSWLRVFRRLSLLASEGISHVQVFRLKESNWFRQWPTTSQSSAALFHIPPTTPHYGKATGSEPTLCKFQNDWFVWASANRYKDSYPQTKKIRLKLGLRVSHQTKNQVTKRVSSYLNERYLQTSQNKKQLPSQKTHEKTGKRLSVKTCL